MSDIKVLVVGGAGYIGSTTSYLLTENGFDVHILDNLSTGYLELAGDSGLLYETDLLAPQAMHNIFEEHEYQAVLHFAAFIEVGQSVTDPLMYYRNNVAGTINLLDVMRTHNVKNLVFSSTAAVYGNPLETPITESHPLAPINPYGWSKRMMEQIFADCQRGWGLNSVCLRYFNAAGADPLGRCGEWHDPESHLVPLALQAAMKKRDKLTIFGNDYDTADGTCVRDYIHVTDLAKAHMLAVDYLFSGGKSAAFNLGSETGYSVKEVIETVEKVTGLEVPCEIGERREGDPAVLVASSEAIRKRLGWKREHSDLEKIVQDAYNWHKREGFCGGRI